MANDMQFFLVSPIIIFALWKWRVPGLSLLGILLAIFTAIPIALGIVNDYPFTESIMGGGNTDIIAYMEDFYVVPWCRWTYKRLATILACQVPALPGRPWFGLPPPPAEEPAPPPHRLQPHRGDVAVADLGGHGLPRHLRPGALPEGCGAGGEHDSESPVRRTAQACLVLFSLLGDPGLRQGDGWVHG